MKKVWLLTTGTGQDGDEWYVESIHSTLEKAKLAKEEYERPRQNDYGHSYILEADIEEWDVN